MDIITKNKLRECYDDLETAIGDLKDKGLNNDAIRELQNSLNKFFDAKCIKVIYTDNTDKLFFGIIAMPSIPAEEVMKTITTGQRYIIQQYYLELDSRLFDNFVNLSKEEITALLLHDVAGLVNDSSPCEVVTRAIDEYLKDNHTVLKISDSIHYMELLSYGFRDALRKATSIFEKAEPDVNDTMNDFYEFCNYRQNLESAYAKLCRAEYIVNRECDDKFVVLSWTLRLYMDVEHNRIPALMMLARCEELTGSKIEKREMENVARRLNRIDDDALIESGMYLPTDNKESLLEEIRLSIKGKSYKTLTESLHDYMDEIILVQNDEQGDPDALPDLLHSINNKMAFIKDYTDHNNISKGELKQLNVIYKDLAKNRNHIELGYLYDTGKRMINNYDKLDEQ